MAYEVYMTQAQVTALAVWVADYLQNPKSKEHARVMELVERRIRAWPMLDMGGQPQGGTMNTRGYKSEPLSTVMEQRIRERLRWLKGHLTEQRIKIPPDMGVNGAQELGRTEGNIGALEWVLREAESIKQE
jgi:hypothetical protein